MNSEDAQEKKRQKRRRRKEAPTCIEEGCERKVQQRQNWHTVNDRQLPSSSSEAGSLFLAGITPEPLAG